jgi:hypothetical protein
MFTWAHVVIGKTPATVRVAVAGFLDGTTATVVGNQSIEHPSFPYRHLFPTASWYYSKGVNTDVKMETQMFADVRWIGFLPPQTNND